MSRSTFGHKTVTLCRTSWKASLVVILVGCASSLPNPQAEWFLPEWEFESPEKVYSYRWETDPSNRNKVLRFEIREDEAWDNKSKKSFRSEVSTNYFPNLFKTCDYSFELKLPADFPIENNRLVLAQWWAKTKKDLGEVARSPAVALRFSNAKLYVTVRHSNDRRIRSPKNKSLKNIADPKVAIC